MSTALIAKSVDQEPKKTENSVSWYSNDIPTISVEARELLEKYSGVAREDVEQHIIKVVSFIFCKGTSCFGEKHT